MREPDAPAEPTDAPGSSASAVAAIEHELINALASIAGFSQLIRRDPALPEELRRSAELLIQETARTRRLVDELLDLARERPVERRPDQPGPTHDPGPDATLPSAAAGLARPRVLVLDNEPSMRVFLEQALAALGYEPVMTSLGAEAVERAAAGDHDVLLFDHQMPGMSGAAAYETIVAARPELAARFVMMSGDLLEPGLDAFAATHPVTLLAKPFDLDTLDRSIRAVLEATGQSRG